MRNASHRGAPPTAQRQARRGLLVCLLLAAATCGAGAAPLEISPVRAVPAGAVPQYQKLELSFRVEGSSATRMQWPYDPAPPNGIPPGVGITVNAVFTDPTGRHFVQPAFYAEEFVDEVREGRDWHLPTGNFSWKVRFSPNRVGSWTYRIVAADRTGTIESAATTFSVVASTKRGFIRVSESDSRYFEFDDGTLFNGMGFEVPAYIDNPSTRGAAEYEAMATHGVNFVRVWISSMFGSAWSTWIGGRNQYRGYLPVTGLVPFHDPTTGQTTLTLKLDYEQAGDTGWFDACRMQLWWEDQAESIKPFTTYRIRVHYRGIGIVGPRNAGDARYGLVAKLGGWHPDCYQSATSTAVTSHGGNNEAFGFIEGRWTSGNEYFLPRMYLALENVQQGAAYVQSVSLMEDLGGGAFGPELMIQPSMEHHLAIPQEKAHSLDEVVEAAEQHGVYLKLVVHEKNDKIYLKMLDNGEWANGADNEDGFYGLGRGMNKTRWLQQMWWRYLQARWGYSPSIHSWELTNEGDPVSADHYAMADEFGKFMHCRAFGVDPGPGDAARCPLDHPNAHLVTTSFWHSFPGAEFWSNARYPNVDYADLHAYVSTSFAPYAERELMQWDAAHFHVWHSQHIRSLRVGKPVVRGEAGLDSTSQQDETILGIRRDTTGVWLHNFLWSGLDSGGLSEIYWWGSHIWNERYDLRPVYGAVRAFLADVPLNKGGFVDWGGTVSTPSLRVVGQKHTAAGSMHLWVQNRQHTWKNVVEGLAIPAVSGDVVVPGFQPGAGYTLEFWDPYATSGRIASIQHLVADSGGSLRIGVPALRTDMALKVYRGPRRPVNLRAVVEAAVREEPRR